jgi:hypothetical protein
LSSKKAQMPHRADPMNREKKMIIKSSKARYNMDTGKS